MPTSTDKKYTDYAGTKRDFGAAGDCGFLSLAGSLLDKGRRGTLNNAILAGRFDQLLAMYAKYFPGLLPLSEQGKSAGEQFNYLIDKVHPDMLVQSMAFVLRQYAVGLIAATPDRYQGAYADITEGTDVSSMSMRGTWVDQTALSALAHQFQIPVLVVTSSNTYEMHDETAELLAEEPVKLHLSGGHYRAEVTDTTFFDKPYDAATVDATGTAHKAATKATTVDSEIAAAEKKFVVFERGSFKREVEASLLLAKCTIEKLVAIYLAKKDASDYLPGRVKEVDKELRASGTTPFFAQLIARKQLNSANKVRAKDELVHALAKQAYIDDKFDAKKAIEDTREVTISDAPLATAVPTCSTFAHVVPSPVERADTTTAAVTTATH